METKIMSQPRATSTAVPTESGPSWLTSGTKELQALSARLGWSLDEAELKAIQTHFKTARREPTRAEIETIAQTWSEHCKHKTFTSPIRYSDGRAGVFSRTCSPRP
jgi:phosphoribosylformylglycinamidine synthase subunit PurL